jgi:hypothetical protein
VRSGSGLWAAGHDSSHDSSAYFASQLRQLSGRSDLSHSHSVAVSAKPESHVDDSGDDLDGTGITVGSSNDGSQVAHGPSITSAQARGQQSGHPGPPRTDATTAIATTKYAEVDSVRGGY